MARQDKNTTAEQSAVVENKEVLEVPAVVETSKDEASVVEALEKKLADTEAELETVKQELAELKENSAIEKQAFLSDWNNLTGDYESVKKELAELKAKYSETPEETVEETPAVEFKYKGENYVFAKKAPKVIRVNGKELSQEEIAEDDEALLELIGGKSSLIIKK